MAMKIYISADIEGVAGITHRDESSKAHPDYQGFQEQMTNEVAAACEGALHAGATEILIKDAHATGRNIIASKLPEQARLIRGWSPHPFGMIQELDESFKAAVMIGYHSRAGSNTHPLAHTLTGGLTHIKINERYASEFLLAYYSAALVNVPLVFISGDEGICREATALNEMIQTVAVSRGVGGSTISVHPHLAVRRIAEGVETGLRRDLSSFKADLPSHFRMEVRFRGHMDAYKASLFPGVMAVDSHTVSFESDDYFELLRVLLFTV
jgi:D-amino peptidase